MDIFHWILSSLNFIAVLMIGYLVKDYFPKYFAKKAENLATKEDIAEITEKVEGVRSEYSTKLENLRSRLDRAKHAHQRQYDLELEVYKSLWKELVALRKATAALRPMMDADLEEGKTEQDRKRERAMKFLEAFTQLEKTVEDNRPFYSSAVWLKVNELRQLAWREAIDYRLSDPKHDFENYWDKAEKNMTAIKDISDNISEAITVRITALNEEA